MILRRLTGFTFQDSDRLRSVEMLPSIRRQPSGSLEVTTWRLTVRIARRSKGWGYRSIESSYTAFRWSGGVSRASRASGPSERCCHGQEEASMASWDSTGCREACNSHGQFQREQETSKIIELYGTDEPLKPWNLLASSTLSQRTTCYLDCYLEEALKPWAWERINRYPGNLTHLQKNRASTLELR